jgi:cytochrome P450
MASSGCPVPHHVRDELVRTFDYKSDPRIAHDFWKLAADMADQPEIFWSTSLGGYWVVAGAEAYAELTLRTDLFSNRDMIPPPRGDIQQGIVMIPHSLDPPEHTKYRKEMMSRMFSARALSFLDEEAPAICKRITDEFAHLGKCDFIEAFARRVPIDLFLSMMGAEPARREEFLYWVQKFFRAVTTEDTREAFGLAFPFVSRWLDEQKARGDNQSHLYGAMQECRIDGRSLTFEEMHSMTLMLFIGGLDTVVSQLSHVACFLAENPSHRQSLIDEPARIPAAVEELLRRFGISNSFRNTTQDVVFRGVQFKKGDMVLLVTPFANLDRRVFKDPLKVDFDRAGRKHWAFGNGAHLCIAAHFARVVVRAAVAEITPRLPDLRLAPGAKPKVLSGGTYAIPYLPLEWTPRAA